MSDTSDTFQARGLGDPHEADDAGHGHAGHDEPARHGNAAPLGPIDWKAWTAGVVGVGAGLVVAACLYVSTVLA
jgi:hypothetical protein